MNLCITLKFSLESDQIFLQDHSEPPLEMARVPKIIKFDILHFNLVVTDAVQVIRRVYAGGCVAPPQKKIEKKEGKSQNQAK